MRPKINFITIAVTDLEKSIDFYKHGLGLPTSGIVAGHEDHCLFELDDNFSLVLYNRADFLKFSARPDETAHSAGFILSHIADSRDQLLQITERVISFGANQIGTLKEESWGCSTSFTDIDGHHWEIVYMIDC